MMNKFAKSGEQVPFVNKTREGGLVSLPKQENFPQPQILRFPSTSLPRLRSEQVGVNAQNDSNGVEILRLSETKLGQDIPHLRSGSAAQSDRLRIGSLAISRASGCKQVRQDFIPPSNDSGDGNPKRFDSPDQKGFQFPPNTKKEVLKAPPKKSVLVPKREKPKKSPTRVAGAVLWKDCPREVLNAAILGLVSAAVPVGASRLTGPGSVTNDKTEKVILPGLPSNNPAQNETVKIPVVKTPTRPKNQRKKK